MFVHKGDDGADDEEAGLAGQPQAESITVQQAGTPNKMQSQLTTVELFTANAGLTISVYDDVSEEATAVQTMYLSQSTPTATYPVLVRPTTVPYTIPSDVLTDLLRMQGHLPLLDAIDAVDTCPKCKSYVDARRYHAAFCPSTRSRIDDAFVRELRDCIRNAGAMVMLEPTHVLPHAPPSDAANARDIHFRPDLQVTHLDTSGKRYLVDVTTIDVTAASYCNGASKCHGAAAAKAEARKTKDYKSKVDGIQTQLIPAAFELNGRWGDGLVLLFKKIVALATKEGRNVNGIFATYWKRRLSIVARTAMITVAHQALRKHLHMGLPAYEDFEDEPEDDMMEL